MSKHTPGPWLLQETTVYALNDERTPVNRFTASIDSGWLNEKARISREEVHANARLISAAPELLEALKCLASIVDKMGDMADVFIHPRPWRELGCEDALAKAKASIAKARGN